MSKNPALFNKTLVIGIIILFIGMSVVSSTGISTSYNSGISLITIKVTGEIGFNDWYVSDVGFNFTYESEDIAEIKYMIDGGPYQNYTEPFYLSDDGNDILLEWCAVNHEGNYSDVDGPFICNIDQTEPEIDLTYEVLGWTPWHGWEFQFTTIATDAMSGMDRVEFYFNNKLKETVYGSGPEYVWTMFYYPLPGTAIFRATAYDKAGNSCSDEIISCTTDFLETSDSSPVVDTENIEVHNYNEDLSRRIVEIQEINENSSSTNLGNNIFNPGYIILALNQKTGNNDWLTDLTIPISYETERINEVYYQINLGEWIPYSEPIIIPDGYYVFTWYAIDSEGYSSTPDSIYFKVDRTKPEINLIRSRIGINKVKFIANVYDETSGITKVKFSSDYGGHFTDYDFPYEWIWTHNYWISWLLNDIVTAKVFDNAGNVNSSSMYCWSSRNYIPQSTNPILLRFIVQFPLLEVLLRIMNL